MPEKEDIIESSWSDDVANDPKHRPQNLDKPSTTARREWCRRPQEAHLAEGDRYRRLSVDEISIIQGFDPSWVNINDIKENAKIAALGNAVPPPISLALAAGILKYYKFVNKSMIEICAGIGGLGYGFDFLKPIALIEMWDIACKILRTDKPWDPGCVFHGLAQDFNYKKYIGEVGLLCGGPPCQPWSQAGRQQGAADPRDVMGFTPTLVSLCEPEVFLFENVPGLVTSKQHKAYLDDLLNRLAQPTDKLSYGIAIGILNAADFGVPQVRRRVFIIGIKNKSSKFASSILQAVEALATHHDPNKPAIGKAKWVTLRQAFIGIQSAEKWRHFNSNTFNENTNNNGEEDIMDLEKEELNTSNQEIIANNITLDVSKISLLWPGCENNLDFANGKWVQKLKSDAQRRHALMFKDKIGKGNGPGGMAIIGDNFEALEALVPYIQNSAKCVYFDSFRRDVLEKYSEPGFVDSVWLSLTKNLAAMAKKNLANDGVLILHVDEDYAHYGRMVLDDVFGREHHITTFAWQKKYAPQNDFTKNIPTDIFDYLIVYSKCHRDRMPKIGLPVPPDDIIDDGDFRGCFTAGHKGARSGNEQSKFKVNAPPYRWEIIESSLPKGKNVFDKFSGVLWIPKLEETGDFWIKIQITDSEDKSVTAKFSFKVKDKKHSSDSFSYPDKIWWLLVNDNKIKKGGLLKFQTTKLPEGLKNESYSIVFQASGGKPFIGKSNAPGSGRFWEFSISTLVEAIAEARVYFGTKGTALPSIKHFHPRENAVVKRAQMNWLPWYDYGKAEDATKHLRSLAADGIIDKDVYAVAKPEKLLYYLIRLFAPNYNDIVIGLGDSNATLAAVALKTGRFAVHITGCTPEDLSQWEKAAKKRIRAVLSKKDKGGINDSSVIDDFKQSEPGPVGIYNISKTALEFTINREIIKIVDNNSAEDISDFYAALIGCSNQWTEKPYYGGLFEERAIVLKSDNIFDPIYASRIAIELNETSKVYIIFERSEIRENEAYPPNIIAVHAPYDLIVRM